MTFTDVHMGRQIVPKSDVQSQFSMTKIIRIFLIFFSLKNISLEEGFHLESSFFTFWYNQQKLTKIFKDFWGFVQEKSI